mmetsp:Transcript_27815/g.93454  ORF Transcript_27815/g.93454 Transcript_27815/m.93454 type:complete len:212 (+) Transcript_27815:1011-1646(+)
MPWSHTSNGEAGDGSTDAAAAAGCGRSGGGGGGGCSSGGGGVSPPSASLASAATLSAASAASRRRPACARCTALSTPLCASSSRRLSERASSRQAWPANGSSLRTEPGSRCWRRDVSAGEARTRSRPPAISSVLDAGARPPAARNPFTAALPLRSTSSRHARASAGRASASAPLAESTAAGEGRSGGGPVVASSPTMERNQFFLPKSGVTA